MVRHNVNDNVDSSLKNKNNINNNINNIDEGTRPKDIKAQRIAAALVEKFDNQQGYMYYLKVGYNLSEYLVWKLAETAFEKGKDPKKYFTWLCKTQMSK